MSVKVPYPKRRALHVLALHLYGYLVVAAGRGCIINLVRAGRKLRDACIYLPIGASYSYLEAPVASEAALA